MSKYSETMTVISRVPMDYNVFGYALSETEFERFDEMIAERIPDELAWCGDEILGPIDYDQEFSVMEIIDEAAERRLKEANAQCERVCEYAESAETIRDCWIDWDTTEDGRTGEFGYPIWRDDPDDPEEKELVGVVLLGEKIRIEMEDGSTVILPEKAE